MWTVYHRLLAFRKYRLASSGTLQILITVLEMIQKASRMCFEIFTICNYVKI
jgi:hypothetical protein